MIRFIYLYFLVSITLSACGKTQDHPGTTVTPGTPITPPTGPSYNYTSDKSHNLNVIYFIPSDVQAPADYHRRLSEILLNTQDFLERKCSATAMDTRLLVC